MDNDRHSSLDNNHDIALEPVAPNPFLRFAHQSEQSSLSKVVTVPSTGKRKATNLDDSLDVKPNSIHLVSSRRNKQKQVVSTDAGLSLGSRRVKIYDDLPELDDHLQNGLDIIFCGINPGKKSSQIGHHYANPTNHFWSCLHQSGLTSRLLDPRQDYTLPQEFSMGLTNLVSRPTIEQRELSKSEQIFGVTELMKKITQHRPRIACFVGLGIADIIKSVLLGKSLKSKTVVGLQPYKVVYPNGNPGETLFFAVSSTSGRVVQYQKTDKVQQFIDLRVLVEKMKNGGLDTTGLTSIDTQSLGIAAVSGD